MEFSFSDISADVSPEQAIEFLTTWFEPGDLVNITCMKAVRNTKRNIHTQSEDLEELVSALSEGPEAMRNVVWRPTDGSEWNVYFGVCPTKKKPESIFRRGGVEMVKHVPGVWSDIDVKDGGFSSQEEILEWVDTLACEPTLIVNSGSGGVHLYWKYEPSTIYKDDYSPEAWWAYLDYMAGEDRSVDNIQDLARVLRLPGTIRFAKVEGEPNTPVRLIRNTGLTYSQKDLRLFSEPFYELKKELVKKKGGKEEELTVSIEKLSFGSNELFGSAVLKKAMLEEKVNSTYSWKDILGYAGWTINRQLRDGQTEWTRPGEGASGRSATTDWADSPHVMSLLSTDPHTGLGDLKELGVALTKMRVMLRLWFEDDIERMVEHVYNEKSE